MEVLMLIQPNKNPLQVIIAQNVDYTDKSRQYPARRLKKSASWVIISHLAAEAYVMLPALVDCV
jgi:fructose-1-phosphate kinase PfkB-like protein